jgi:MraZ protein
MALFLYRYLNKVDRKGRVSVPASFRASLAGQSIAGIIAFPSYTLPSIECFGSERMERLSASLDELDLFSARQNDLAMTLFADAQPLTFDGEGRIVLPQDLVEHAKITTQALFVGAGPTFQIWEPETFTRVKPEARERARSQGLTLKLKGGTGAAGDGQGNAP